MTHSSLKSRAMNGRWTLGSTIGLILLPWFLSAQPHDPSASTGQFRLLLQGSLLGGHTGISRHDMDWPTSPWANSSWYDITTIGLGLQWRDIGILIGSRWTGSTSGIAVMYAGDPADFDTYLQVVYGATERCSSPRPALYAYTGLDDLRFRRYDDVHVGVGAKWRFYVVSPDLRISWHRTRSPERVYPPIQYNFVEATPGLELGGLWALRLN